MAQADDADIELDGAGEEVLDYRAVSALAIVALLLGLASVLALSTILFWALPLVAIGTSLFALGRIKRSGGSLTGYPVALAGLGLAVFFGSAAVAQYYAVEGLLAARAEQVGLEWFAALAHGQPQVAHQLGQAGVVRPRKSDPEELWTYYRKSAERRRELEKFVKEPLINTLLALDGQARVRLFETGEIVHAELKSLIVQRYAVTFGDPQRQTFFVDLTIERSIQPNTHNANQKVDWRVLRYGVERGD